MTNTDGDVPEYEATETIVPTHPDIMDKLCRLGRIQELFAGPRKDEPNVLHILMSDHPPIPHRSDGMNCWCEPELFHSDDNGTVVKHRRIQ